MSTYTTTTNLDAAMRAFALGISGPNGVTSWEATPDADRKTCLDAMAAAIDAWESSPATSEASCLQCSPADVNRALGRGYCDEQGPWGARCTDQVGHRYSHHDGRADTSFTDRWREECADEGHVPPEDERIEPSGGTGA